MTQDERNAIYQKTVTMLKPALERVASDEEFRRRMEFDPLQALDEMRVELDTETRDEMRGKRFSAFWAARRRAVEGPVEVRDLPPADDTLDDRQLEAVAGGLNFVSPSLSVNFAPPYVPVGPA